ncbi:MAG: type II secretion system F family protein [Phycisphaerae bacterium]|nr:type II secretion system F family protein [Gemmatimonadaceae bacterium]
MPTYAYEAVTTSGRKSKGREEASSTGALTQSLEARGLFVLNIVEATGNAETLKFRFGRKREVLEATRALATLLPVGMPLSQALNAATGVTTGDVKAAMQDVRTHVERGETLSTALSRHPGLFPPIYIGLVRAGERSGDVDTTFARLAEQLEREESIRGKVLSAAIYPILLAVAGTVAVSVLMLFVLPRFVGLLEGSGAKLPTSTTMLLNLSAFMRRVWPVFLLIPVFIASFSAWVRASENGARFWSRLLLAIPLVNTLRRYALAARLARLLAVLLGGGAPLLVALDDTIDSVDDPIARDDVKQIRARVREGTSLRQAVAESPLYPPLLPQLIGVGEDAGQLRAFLHKAAEIFEERTERATQRLATLAEPVMIVVFGLIVAFVAMSLLQAIYGINAGSFR